MNTESLADALAQLDVDAQIAETNAAVAAREGRTGDAAHAAQLAAGLRLAAAEVRAGV